MADEIPSQIRDILEETLDKEGWPAYTDHPQDRGGPTKGGVTLRTLDSWRGRRCTRKELERLTKKEAIEILRRRYIDVQGIHKLSDLEIQAQVVDDAIHSGPVLAVKDLQRAIDVKDDGIIGPITFERIVNLGDEESSKRLAVERTIRLTRIVAKDSSQLVWLVGWVTRSLGFITK